MIPNLLFLVYAIHLAVFGFAWWRKREGVYLILMATFVLLVATHALRVFAPGLGVDVGDVFVAAFWPLRVAAWICAGLGVMLLGLRRLRAWRNR